MTGQGCLVSRAPPGRLQVKRQLGITKSRMFVRVSAVSPNIDVVPFNHDIDTLERAVKERVFFVKSKDGAFVEPPRPVASVFLGRMEPVKDLLVKHLPSTAPWSYQQFVDSYKGRKKLNYQKALQELRLGNTTLAKDAEVKVFIKYEKTDRTTKLDPVPRVISPRDPKYNLRVGRFLKKIEEPVFESLGELFGHQTVMKGMDTIEVARVMREKWDMFNNPVAIGLDASRFDQHVSKVALEFEHSIYPLCFGRKIWRDKLSKLLKFQLVNHCRGFAPDGSLSYDVEGTRMSGDMNTSLGNCVLMCMMIFAYGRDRRINIQLANNGDDCVVFLEKADLARFSNGLYEWFLEMGFNMAIEAPCFDFAHIEFCQMKPVYDGEGWTMCRNPIRAIAKDSVFLSPGSDPTGKIFRLWLHAVGTGGIRLAGRIPVFQSFYQLYRRSGSETEYSARLGRHHGFTTDEFLPWFMREASLGGKRDAGPISPECRASFYDAFDITPDEQIALEQYYDSMSIKREFGSYEPRLVFSD